MNLFQLILGLLAGTFATPPSSNFLVADPTVLDCATAELHDARLITNPKYAEETARMEDEWAKAAGKAGEKSVAATPYVLPIVFHIVHENGAENIPDSDVLRSVDYLNQALANTNYYDPATGVDTEIQVCMARRTPDNQPTNGINRIVSPLTDLNSDDDRELKDLSRWEPRDYVNVWVVKEICGLGLGCGVAGYAYYPSAHGGNVDGIVMEARWLAGDEARVGVLIHELGHYLGLRHTFDGGCGNDDCTRNGDRVCDTPPDQSKVAVPCTGSANSCSTDTDSGPFATDQDDMFINYMDYGYFRCYSAFTAGQRDRMHFFLDGRRRSILESKGCEEPCPALVTAGFSGGDVTVEVGSIVNFTNTSVNGDGFTWRENGSTFGATANITRTFPTAGVYRILLLAESANPQLCRADSISATVTVVCSVNANFNLPGVLPRVEESIRFTNTSSGGGQRNWTINGTPTSTAEDLDHTFLTPGFYEICLTESNGACDDQQCINLLIYPAPCQGPGCPGDTTNTGGCGTPLQLNYAAEEGPLPGAFTHLLRMPDGYIIGGSLLDASLISGQEATIMRVNDRGDIIWQQRFQNEINSELKEIILDRDGFIAGIGSSINDNQNGRQSFVFRVDPTDGTVRWTRSILSEVAGVTISEIIQPAPGASYRCFGTLENSEATNPGNKSGLILQLALLDGSIIPGSSFTQGSERYVGIEAATIHPITGNYYLVGDFTTSPNSGGGTLIMQGIHLTALDPLGGILWTRLLWTDPGSDTPENLFVTDVEMDGDTIVVLAENTVDGIEGIEKILRFNLNGETLDGFEILGTGSPLTNTGSNTSLKFLVNQSGYLIYKPVLSVTDFIHREYLTQTIRNGDVAWAKQYRGGARRANKGVAMNGDSISLTYIDERNGGMLSVLRLSSAGVASVCIPQDTLPAFSRPNTLRNSTTTLRARETFLFSFEEQWAPNQLVQVDFVCPEDCPEDEGDDCTDPFRLQLTENDAVDDGIFTAITSRNGVYYVGGRVNFLPYLAALRGNGEIIWQRRISTLGVRNTVRHLNFDDEGMLVGVSSLGPNNSPNPIIFKIDPATGNAVWIRQVLPDNDTGLSKLLVTRTGENYRLIGRSDEQDVRLGMTVEIDRATGVPIGPAAVFPGATTGGFVDGIVDPDTGVTYVLSTDVQSSTPKARVTAIGPNNAIIWNKSYGLAQGEILARSLYLIDGQLVIASVLSFQGGRSVVLTLGLDGELIRAVEHEYPGTSLSIQGIADRPESDQLELLFYDPAERRWLLNRRGIPLSNVLENSRSGSNWVTDPFLTQSFAYDGTHLLVTGRNGLTGSPVLEALRVDSSSVAQVCEGEIYFPSNYGTNTINIVETDLTSRPPTNPLSLTTSTAELLPGSLTLAPNNSCPQDCNEEICGNQIDDDQDGLVDCDDPDLASTCCCLPDPTVNLGPDTLLCPGDILREGSNSQFTTYEWSTGERTDSIVVSEAGTYWLMVTDSCGRTTSDTITLHPRSRPQLELGPDTTLCANAIVPFLAQDGFASYEWTDGTTEKDFTAFEAGTYWVVATDSCGGVQADTVRVNIDPATVIDLGRDTTICPGDVLTFRVDGFTNYQWSQSSFIDCFDCPEVHFAPTSDTLLLLAAQQGPGCFSSDSIRVRIAETAGSRDSVYLCPGDSVIFDELAIFNQGQYYDVQQISSCELTDTLDVFTLRDTLTSEVLTICTGDSVLVFEAYVREASLYRRIYTSGNGCDSIHQVEVIVLDTSRTAETIAICAGDSSLIFGVFEQNPGVYSQTFTNTVGCDSTHDVTLEVNEILISVVQTRPDCGGSNPGWGEVIFESDGFFEVRWSDGSFFKRNERLFAGINYTVTVTDGNGCMVIDTLTVDAAVPPVLQSYVIDESCPGANDGEIGIITDENDLRFSLEDGPWLTIPTFEDLADGTYRIKVEDGDGCTSRLDLEVGGAVEYSLELPEELFINLGDSVVLTPDTDFPLSELRWFNDGTPACEGCPVLRLLPEQTLLVTAVAGDDINCATTAEVRINVNREELFYVPNAFSPNGDTLNEDFRVYAGPAVTRILSFRVFDRWGGQVFQRENFDPEDALGQWDGRLANGRDPSLGVYVYQVQVELFTGEVVSQAGEVLVMR